MRSYIAQHGRQSHAGSWGNCIAWAHKRVQADPSAAINILTARAGERHARVAAEVTAEGVRLIRGGRICEVRSVRPDGPAAA